MLCMSWGPSWHVNVAGGLHSTGMSENESFLQCLRSFQTCGLAPTDIPLARAPGWTTRSMRIREKVHRCVMWRVRSSICSPDGIRCYSRPLMTSHWNETNLGWSWFANNNMLLISCQSTAQRCPAACRFSRGLLRAVGCDWGYVDSRHRSLALVTGGQGRRKRIGSELGLRNARHFQSFPPRSLQHAAPNVNWQLMSIGFLMFLHGSAPVPCRYYINHSSDMACSHPIGTCSEKKATHPPSTTTIPVQPH